jgi:hypothetical protein
VYKLSESNGIIDKNNDSVPDVDEGTYTDTNNNNKVDDGDSVTSGTDGKEDVIVDQNGDNNTTIPTGAVFSVDITWGNMTFVYSKTGTLTWDPSSKQYTGGTGAWAPAADSDVNNDGIVDTSNLFTVTNNSNVAVLAEFNYVKPTAEDSIYKNVEGKLYNSNDVTKAQLAYNMKYSNNNVIATKQIKNAFGVADAVRFSGNDTVQKGYLHLEGEPTKVWSNPETIGSVTIKISYNIMQDKDDGNSTVSGS